MRGGVVRVDHHLIVEQYRPMAHGTSAGAGLAQCAKLMNELLEAAGLTRADIKATVAGVPGPLNSASGETGAGAILPEWTGINLPERFAAALGLPVVVENDANPGGSGEFTWATNLETVSPRVYVRLSTGIGCGILIDEARVWRGAAGTGGELGHISLDPTGRLCRCGNRGCLETMASTQVLLENLSAALEQPVTLEQWLAMAMRGENASVRLLEDMGRNVGSALATMVNLLSPAVVVVGGPITEAGDLLLTPIKESIIRRSMPAPGALIDVRLPRHPGMSELHGALALAASAARSAFIS
jgi:predicted NBD/HSP70 family sugar kinase